MMYQCTKSHCLRTKLLSLQVLLPVAVVVYKLVIVALTLERTSVRSLIVRNANTSKL